MTRPPNPMLVFTIHEALRQGQGDVEQSLWHAVVHAWMEGHIEAEAENDRVVPAPVVVGPDEMPSPPFPKAGSAKLDEIVDEATARFGKRTHLAAAYASVLAWEAGRAEGALCRGCAYRGEEAVAGPIRAGRGKFELRYIAGAEAEADRRGRARRRPHS